MNKRSEINATNRSNMAEEMQARVNVEEEDGIRLRNEKTTTRRTYCLLGLAAVIVLLASLMHWTASVLGFFASFLWQLAVRKNRVSATILGIVGYLAIPVPFIPLVLRHPYLAGIPVGVVMIAWLIIGRVVGKALKQFADEEILSYGDKFWGEFWVWLLRIHPLFAKWCDWSKLDGEDWATLLEERPQFADRCDWRKLDGNNWTSLLEKQPQFADKRGK